MRENINKINHNLLDATKALEERVSVQESTIKTLVDRVMAHDEEIVLLKELTEV